MIDHLGLTVSDLEQSKRFFERALAPEPGLQNIFGKTIHDARVRWSLAQVEAQRGDRSRALELARAAAPVLRRGDHYEQQLAAAAATWVP